MNRFAPSTTGRAHPGTLLAALLCWLDARSRGDAVILRLEDLDPQRCRPEWLAGLRADLAWFGLDWDREVVQSQRAAVHARALANLVELGLIYPCTCSRSQIKKRCPRALDGGSVYDGHCCDRSLPADWRSADCTLRLRLPSGTVVLRDESGLDLSQDVAAAMGDPVVRRRDGAVAYHLASVVDDAEDGVTRVVRGRDLAWSSAVQVVIQDALGLPRPVYRHHLLLLEAEGGKHSKFHAAVAADRLGEVMSAGALCGLLAMVAGLRDEAHPLEPTALVQGFSWDRVRVVDQVLDWTGRELRWLGAPA